MSMVVGLRPVTQESARNVEGISDRAHAESAARTVGHSGKGERPAARQPATPGCGTAEREVA